MTWTLPKFRRLGVEHWTPQDFEMERVGLVLNAAVYRRRLDVLEGAGWVPCQGPFYYANREFHGGHRRPATGERVPTAVAFAMFREENSSVELEPYPPHPHGWRPPPSTFGLLKTELVTPEPMKAPVGSLFFQESALFNSEERARGERWHFFCSQFTGARNACLGTTSEHGKGLTKAVFVTLEQEIPEFPEEWEGFPVRAKVFPVKEEQATQERQRAAMKARLDEELSWLKKARDLE